MCRARTCVCVAAWSAAVAALCGDPALAAGATAGAAAAPRLRALLRVTSPVDGAFAARLRGQTSDLPVDVVEVPASALEPTLDGQLGAAAALLRDQRAGVVLWLAHDDLVAYIAGAPAPRLLVRPVSKGGAADTSGGAAPASADLEAAALIARAALKAVVEGEPVGDPRPPPLPAVAVSSPPPPAHPLSAFVAVDGMVAADGVASDPVGGFMARLGARTGRLAGGLELSTTLDKDLPRVMSTTFARRAVQALFAVDVLRAGRARVAAEIAAGLEWFRLREPPSQNQSPPQTEERLWMGSGGLRGAFALSGWRHALVELTLGVGSDLVPHPPTIRRAGTTLWKLWRFEPRGILGVEVTLR